MMPFDLYYLSAPVKKDHVAEPVCVYLCPAIDLAVVTATRRENLHSKLPLTLRSESECDVRIFIPVQTFALGTHPEILVLVYPAFTRQTKHTCAFRPGTGVRWGV